MLRYAGRLILQQGSTARLKKRSRLDTAAKPRGLLSASSSATATLAANRNDSQQITAAVDIIPTSSPYTTAGGDARLEEPALEQIHTEPARPGEVDGGISGGFNEPALEQSHPGPVKQWETGSGISGGVTDSQESRGEELLLVIYAPRKGVLDVFSGRHGPAVLSLPCSSNCRCWLCTFVVTLAWIRVDFVSVG